MALLVLMALSGLAMAGHLVSTTDYRINQNHTASLRAFYLADRGFSDFLARGKVRTDTSVYTYGGGTASVILEPLLTVDDSSNLYILTSVGRHAPPEGGLAVRTLSAAVIRKAAGFRVNAALTAAGGLEKNGNAGSVSGLDAATPADCPVGGTEDVAGLAVPPGGFSQNGNGKGKGSGSGFVGNPGIDSTQTAVALLGGTHIDWQGLLDESFAQADYVLSRDGFPDFGSLGADEWPLILIDQASFSMTPPQSGRGTLVVQGDLTLNGNVRWDGLILVGDELESNGLQHVAGAVVTGLNLLLGQTAEESNLGNGNWDYRYHSCNVLAALKAIGSLIEEPGTWFEKM